MQLLNNLQDIIDGYDLFIFDVFGVIWNGKEHYRGAKELLHHLKEKNKTVIIFSNDPCPSATVKERNKKRNLLEGEHYDDIVTSGDISNYLLSNGLLSFSNNTAPLKCYIFGKPRENVLANSPYQQVLNPAEADFVYMGFPQLTQKDYDNYAHKDELVYSPMVKEGDIYLYDSLTLESFKAQLEELLKYNLPLFNDSPDMKALQTPPKGKVPNVEAGCEEPNYVIRHGTLVAEYKKMGGEVLECGKPHADSYLYLLNKTAEYLGVSLAQLSQYRMLMVGDTIETDLLGATNATKYLGCKIDSLLTLCGVAGSRANKNLDLVAKEASFYGVNIDYAVDSLAVFLD